jgi:3-deoxy-7-phosphoheptulonate synthase
MSLLLDWNINSWIDKPSSQAVNYSSNAELNFIYQQLKASLPLVEVQEISSLNEAMSKANRGEAIVLQAGDCAEAFDSSEEYTANQARFIQLLGLILRAGQKQDVVTIGRIAGQYAKPRSSEVEIQDGLSLPSYRGDIINNFKFDKHSRAPNPSLMLKAYELSKRNLDIIRFRTRGCKDFLNKLKHNFSLHTLDSNLVNNLDIAFSDHDFSANPQTIYSSHESLHLPYESALTRRVEGYWYNLSAHFLWVGLRTSHLNSSHLEYIRGINNPIAVKISSLHTPAELLSLVVSLNPQNKPGRLALIYRFGCSDISKFLPKMLSTLRKAQKNVTWIVDPMHGNTKLSKFGYKTRYYEEIVTELRLAKSIHRQLGVRLGGIHLEATYENVTECLGGPQMLSELDIKTNYTTLVDPRLNFTQAISLLHQYNQF